ncbi:MAG TPA: uracil permease [Acholeplasmataceae bacterium]|nr:uracil permease [Acholeplasmataceae bacterium]
MILGVKDKPTKGKWFVLSFQHLFAMFGATVLVPMLTGLPISVALFTSGVGTLIYILCTKAKVPVYLGSSFAYINVIILVSGYNQLTGTPGHYGAALTGLAVVGLVYVLFAVLIKLLGTEWINKLLPPVIIGPMIIIIGLSLAGAAVDSAGLISGSWKEILTAFVSFIIVAVVALRSKGFLKIIPFLIGIVGGFVFAAIIGIVDFTNFLNVIKTPAEWVKIPEFMFLGFKEGTTTFLGTNITFYKFDFAAVLTIAPLALVTAAEHIGDHAVISKIVGEDFLQDPGLHKTLLGDGLATSFAALVGGPANTTYGENTSVVGMTKVASVWVTGGAAVIAIILSFLNIFVTLIGSIPSAVMGGISIILYGFIAANGLRVMADAKVKFSNTKNLIIISTMLVLGLGGATIKFGDFAFSGMSLAAVIGILLHFLLPNPKEE